MQKVKLHIHRIAGPEPCRRLDLQHPLLDAAFIVPAPFLQLVHHPQRYRIVLHRVLEPLLKHLVIAEPFGFLDIHILIEVPQCKVADPYLAMYFSSALYASSTHL